MQQRKAYAKINLSLDVVGKRADGYHLVKMIMQTVDLFDVLAFEKTDTPGIRIALGNCKNPDAQQQVPLGEDNLIYKAATAFFQKFLPDEGQGVSILLEKNIPIAAGMAGGSTDAAATINGLNDLFAAGVSIEDRKKLAVMIGADVPYCIEGGTQLSEGIGEILTVLPAPPKMHLVIAKPDLSISTKYVYQHLRLDADLVHPDVDGMQEAIKRGDFQGITSRLGNVLESVTLSENPVIGEIKRILMEQGAENALMSGSGPTTFGIFRDRETAQKAYSVLEGTGIVRQLFITGLHN